MRAMIVAGALAAAATSANAAETAACYDSAVVGSMVGHANDRYLDATPLVAGRIMPRVQSDALIKSWSPVAGAATPRQFWARAVLTSLVDPNSVFLIYLKNEPDGVPSVVDYRFAPMLYRDARATAYLPC